ncbi:MAG TPA: hypothetical protein VJO35_06780 [Terriglobales bacterium]|nr:hypothetical protein [Terriglobales bacterium]
MTLWTAAKRSGCVAMQFSAIFILHEGDRKVYFKVGALRWPDCDFEKDLFKIQHSYDWRRGGILKSTKTKASAKHFDASVAP